MANIQHPDITAAERTGYPAIPNIWYNSAGADDHPKCPICLEKCDKVYRNCKKILSAVIIVLLSVTLLTLMSVSNNYSKKQ